jgi:hypothetical protein
MHKSSKKKSRDDGDGDILMSARTKQVLGKDGYNIYEHIIISAQIEI